jgi:hypothetical protein
MSICALNQIVANIDNFIFYCDSFILTSVFKNEHNEVAYRPKLEDKYNKRDRNIFKYALDESHRSSNITI